MCKKIAILFFFLTGVNLILELVTDSFILYILVPVYTSKHRVIAAPWSYPEDIVSQVIGIEDSEITENQRVVDCRRGPPNYEESQEYIKQIKEDLGIEVKTHV